MHKWLWNNLKKALHKGVSLGILFLIAEIIFKAKDK